MCFFCVMLFFVGLTVIVAMGDRIVVVGVRVPPRPVFEVVPKPAGVVMADMPMVVGVSDGWMGMRPSLAVAFSPLRHLASSLGACRKPPAAGAALPRWRSSRRRHAATSGDPHARAEIRD
jgi:hypothetical protein